MSVSGAEIYADQELRNRCICTFVTKLGAKYENVSLVVGPAIEAG